VAVLFDRAGEAIGWQAGNVLGIAVHGLFEDAAVLRALFGRAARTLDERFDALADLLEQGLGSAALRALLHA
jgi:adenosylcobyric acid synthase